MIKCLLMDVDDTLLDFPWQEFHAIHRTWKALGTPMTEEMYARYHAVNRGYWMAYERGEIDRADMLIARHAQMFEEYGLPYDAAECERIYRNNLGIGYKLIPHAIEILDWLKPRCRLFITSNGVAETQYSRLGSSGLDQYFEGIFISEEIGAVKPSKEYFAHVFSRIEDFRPEETAIVGDSLSSDILGGINAGIQTIWFNPNQKPGRTEVRPDHEITDLLELKNLI